MPAWRNPSVDRDARARRVTSAPCPDKNLRMLLHLAASALDAVVLMMKPGRHALPLVGEED